jgi:hypothetical protein
MSHSTHRGRSDVEEQRDVVLRGASLVVVGRRVRSVRAVRAVRGVLVPAPRARASARARARAYAHARRAARAVQRLAPLRHRRACRPRLQYTICYPVTY